MKKIRLGKTKLQVSPITLGCWAIGAGAEWGARLDDDVYLSTMERAFEKGINFFDTAQAYGKGHSEQLTGKMAKKYKEGIVVSTKASAPLVLPKNAEKTVDASRKRLGMDVIDVFFIHWPDADIDIRYNMQALQRLKDRGRIKAIGLSNGTLEHVKKACEEADLSVIQPCYNLYWQRADQDLLPYCKKRGIGVMTYTSIASGLLTGKFDKNKSFEKSDLRHDYLALFQKDVYEAAVDATEQVRAIGKIYGKTPAQTAIRWILHNQNVTTAIVGAKTSAQVDENVEALSFSLSSEHVTQLQTIGKTISDMVDDWDTMYRKDDDRLRVAT